MKAIAKDCSLVKDYMLTSLRNHNSHNLWPRKTFPVNPYIPVGLWRATYSNKQTGNDDSGSDVQCDHRVHEPSHVGGVLDAQEEQADGNFAEHDRDESLHPVQPANELKTPSLIWLQIIHVSSQAVGNFSGHKS